MVSPFILSFLPFPLTGERKVRNHCTGIDELNGLYLLRHANHQMHMCLIVSSVKIITKHVAAMYRFRLAKIVSC